MMKIQREIRPLLRTQFFKADYFLEIATLLALIATWLLPVFTYNSLPEIVPTHFNFKGQADGWGSRTSIFLLPALSLVMFFGLTVLNKFPNKFNYPVKITEENAQALYNKATRLVRVIKTFIIILFLFIEFQICNSAQNAQLPAWLLPSILLLLALLPIVMAFTLTNYFSRDKNRQRH